MRQPSADYSIKPCMTYSAWRPSSTEVNVSLPVAIGVGVSGAPVEATEMGLFGKTTQWFHLVGLKAFCSGVATHPSTACFIIIEPVDGPGSGRLLVGVLPVRLYQLRHTYMLAAHDWINIHDTRCRREA